LKTQFLPRRNCGLNTEFLNVNTGGTWRTSEALKVSVYTANFSRVETNPKDVALLSSKRFAYEWLELANTDRNYP